MTITELAVKKARQSIPKFRISAIGLNTKEEIVASATNAPKFNRKGLCRSITSSKLGSTSMSTGELYSKALEEDE